MTSVIVVLTGIFTIFLLSAVSGGRFFLATGFVALMPARRILDFAFFGVACFAAILRAGLALALPRFELFLRAATRFFALAMSISPEAGGRHRPNVSHVALSPSDSPRGSDDADKNPHQVERRHHGKDHPSIKENVFSSISDHPNSG
jgi:hypothetical protein